MNLNEGSERGDDVQVESLDDDDVDVWCGNATVANGGFYINNNSSSGSAMVGLFSFCVKGARVTLYYVHFTIAGRGGKSTVGGME